MLTSNGYSLDESPQRIGLLDPVPASEMRDFDALWHRIRNDGYLYLKGFLPSQDVQDFRHYYFKSLAGTGLHRVGTDPGQGISAEQKPDQAALRRVLFDSIVPGTEYAGLTAHPRIVDWFKWFLADDVHLHRRKIIRHTRPGDAGIGTATQAHYDLVYLREGADKVLSMWIPLGDCPRSRGGLVYLEQSHRWVLAEEAAGTLPQPAASITADLPGLAQKHDARWLAADYQAGDVVVHSAHMVHAALDNVDPDGVIRLSTDIRYQRSGEPIDWRWQNDWNWADGL